MITKQIAHYHVEEELGRGGMGVVYKAHDTKLDRTVALKFLPHEITSSVEDHARFLQEARAASALNHPNICAIHALGEHEGLEFIDMEYIEGKTLRKLIPVSKLEDAITFAIQIAEALHEAHAKGIVHRDVKTDNIMVTAKNQIKVLDFGLAKLRGSMKLTKTSSTVGTLAYMAPEQIQEGEIDARSDIFSFGVVLYEMLTGHLPFQGEHEAALLYSIVNNDSEPIAQYRPDLPQEILHIIGKVLEKDPEDRYQSATDLLVDLRRVKKQSSRVLRPSAPSQFIGNLSSRPTRYGRRVRWISGIAATVVVGAAVLLFFRDHRKLEFNPNYSSRKLDLPFSAIGAYTMTRDGNYIAFGARDESGIWGIYWTPLGEIRPRKVLSFPKSTNFQDLYISTDGSKIAYQLLIWPDWRSDIGVVSTQGGAGRIIVEGGRLAGVWHPFLDRLGYLKGPDFAIPSVSGKWEWWSISSDGGSPKLEYAEDDTGKRDFRRPCWSPDAKSFVYSRKFKGGNSVLMIREFSTGKERQLTSDDTSILEAQAWTDLGTIVYISYRDVPHFYLCAIDAVGGESVQLMKLEEGKSGSADVSGNARKILMHQFDNSYTVSLARLDSPSVRTVFSTSQGCGTPTLSPDGKQLAWTMFDPVEQTSRLFVADRDGSNQRALTGGEDNCVDADWSPDGKWIACTVAYKPDSAGVFILDALRPSKRRYVANGGFLYWVNSKTLLCINFGGSFVTSIDSLGPERVYSDSTLALPVLQNSYYIARNQGPRGDAWWLMPASSRGKPLGPPGVRLMPREVWPALTHRRNSIMYAKTPFELWKMSLPDGHEVRIPINLPPNVRLDQFALSYDDREIVILTKNRRDRLVLIEDLLKK